MRFTLSSLQFILPGFCNFFCCLGSTHLLQCLGGFGHVFFKVLIEQINENVYKILKYVFIKFAQTYMQKCITWLKNLKIVARNGIKLVLKVVNTQEN